MIIANNDGSSVVMNSDAWPGYLALGVELEA
jgi:hypothetical protein